ncbi:hypothetical protein Hypma_016415 [Hypsizygus marmoreus]|uniref:beta-glucosidase n=1 Tax=Hypsizygus marmoreus TaxID=39966 RepID=A0A369IXN2_HYPMA|nr:hypothetical protein Hypma_016415 [Hypsizygus marmoreus]
MFELGHDHSSSLVQRWTSWILDGDGEERTVESDEDKALMRKVAAESIVLLKNEGQILPLKPEGLKKIAIVRANAKAIVLSGGRSAALKASQFVSPYDGIVNALASQGNIDITYSEGARAYMTMPASCPLTALLFFHRL